jgi:hypothetical protein
LTPNSPPSWVLIGPLQLGSGGTVLRRRHVTGELREERGGGHDRLEYMGSTRGRAIKQEGLTTSGEVDVRLV